MDCQTLLADYARTGSDAAFRELVARYVDLVYSTALRLVEGDRPQAEDVAQTVFVDLARTARTLAREVKLGGWLHRHTCFVATNTMRGERRRQSRERQAVEMNALHDDSGANFVRMAPILDEAINELGDADRTAILLRFYEQEEFRSVGAALGSTEDAARMRVTRALEKLQERLVRRGVTTSATALSVAMTAHAVQAAPVGLAVTISTAAALAGISLVTAATITTHTTMNWINIKSVAAILAAALGTGTATYLVQQRETNRLRTEGQNLMAQHESTANERDAALSAARATTDELERLRKDQAELLRLRGEIGPMRRQLESQKTLARQQPAGAKPADPAVVPPGAYLTREQLTHVGYATPEAAFQTIYWAMMKGTYDQVNEGLSSEALASELKNPKGRAGFEARQKVMAPLFKGLQIVAKKLLADNNVELKMKMDVDPFPGQRQQMPPFMIQPMVKVGDAWKLGGSTRGHQESWDKDGEIQTHAP